MTLKETNHRHRPHLPAWVHRGVAVGSVGLVLGLSFVAASPGLHRWLHPDAGRPGHVCAITLFQHGGLEAGISALVVAVALPVVGHRKMAPVGPDLLAPEFRLRPGRAPPGR